MVIDAADLDSLLAWVQNAADPVDLDRVIVEAARLTLQREKPIRAYAPGGHYTVGERLWLEGERADVVGLQRYGNPKQGTFTVLKLRTAAGTLRRAVADVPGAPQMALSPAVSDADVAQCVAARGAELRAAILNDARLAACLTGPPAASPDAHRGARPAGLFAEHVLARELAALGDPDRLRQDFAAWQELWARVEERGAALDATQTWHAFIWPILQRLGWSAAALPDGAYALFADPGHAERAAQSDLQDAADVLAIVIPVGWGRPLGQGDLAAAGSPAVRCVERLLSTGVPWGFVTNGRCWRLYRRSWDDPDIGSTSAEYHEIHLQTVFASLPAAGTPRAAHWERFKRWWWLFRRSSYRPGAGGHVLVERLKRESARYAHTVTRWLRRRLLESVLPEIAGGFVAFRYRTHNIRTETPEALRDISRASLGFVYRLLFVLYAETRHWLPIDNPDYRGQSLSTLVRWAQDAVDRGTPLSTSTDVTVRYDALLALFRSLEYGRLGYGLPSYSGGLFSPVEPDHGFLERHRLSDRVVARVLASLTRCNGEAVDYGGLTVRHLSTIGEGLLENELWIVEASAGQVAFVNDQGAFDVTGQPPVPDYIGVSVLERALAQVMAGRGQCFAAAMDRVTVLARAAAASDRTAALAEAEQAAYDALLDVKVLDPAMGAGSFLICTIDVLVDAAMRELVAYHRVHPWVPWSWNPVWRAIVGTREARLRAAEAKGIHLDPELLDDHVILARLIAERTIYGVDLDDHAVALSQTSVRMRAFTPGAPFPFLGAHLLHGNSLRGVRPQALAADLAAALPVSPPAAEQDAASAEVAALQARRIVCDLVAARDLGDAEAGALLAQLDDEVIAVLQGAAPLNSTALAFLTKAAELRERYHFVHWDVAFPDVFLRQKDEAAVGFDVVTGSPPAEVPSPAAPDDLVAFARSPESPFMVLARQVVRQPEGRIALVLTPGVQVERSG